MVVSFNLSELEISRLNTDLSAILNQAFDPAELGTVHHTQQHSKQVQALVQNLSSTSHHSAAGPSTSLPPSPALSNATPTPTLAHAVPVESPVVKRTLSVEGGAEESEMAPTLAGESSAGRGAGPPLVSTPAGASSTAPPAAGAPVEEGGVKKKRRVELKHLYVPFPSTSLPCFRRTRFSWR